MVLLVFKELVNFSFLGISGWGIDLDYCDVEWFALETNQDHSIIFETLLIYFICREHHTKCKTLHNAIL